MRNPNWPYYFCFIALITASGCKTTHVLTCGDGRQVISYKNPEKQYPAFVKSHETAFKGTISVLDKVKLADIDLSTKTSVTELRNKLNDESARFEIIAKSSYLKFNQDPCGQNDEYYKLLNRLTDLETLRTNLDSSLHSGGIGGVDNDKIKKAISDYNTKTGS